MSDYRLRHIGQGRGEIYDERFRQNRTFFYWHYYEKPLLEELFAGISREKGLSVLDFACGTGRITGILKNYFERIVGVDISPDMLEQARKALPDIEFVNADLTEGNIAIGKFDLITAFRFFLNAQPMLRKQALEVFTKNLNPGGYLILNNHLRAASIAGKLIQFGRKAGITKRNCLGDEELEDLLIQHGFSVEKAFSFCLIPGFHRFPPVSHRKSFFY
jgi:ubiquinone/menaquinone biosynthesis C-methylase UbiE